MIFQVAKNFFAREPDAFQIVRLKMQPVADGELPPGFFARINHLLAFFRRHLHRLFAQDMFARLRRLDRVFGMQRVGRDDIDDINVGIVRHLLHRVVIVNIFVGQIVLRLPFFRLGGRAGDDPGQPAEFCLLQCGCDLIRAQATEADEGKAQFPVRVGGAEGWRKCFDEWQAGGGEGTGLDKVAAGGEGGFHAASLFIIDPLQLGKLAAGSSYLRHKFFWRNRRSADCLLRDGSEETLTSRIGMLPANVHPGVGYNYQRHPIIQVAGDLQSCGLPQRDRQLPGESL